MTISPDAGRPATADNLIDVSRLLDAYHAVFPDPANPGQRVSFGTSGHRGTSGNGSFNERHILAIAQAICEQRLSAGIDGPLFLGIDTHALSAPARDTAIEVFAANGVTLMIDDADGFTPTPVVSHAILRYNRDRASGLADGVLLTPSHNPPEDGGIKYNPPSGGPADTDITKWIQDRANALLENGARDVRRMPLERALKASTTHRHDYRSEYVDDLASVIDFDVIRGASLSLGVDPLGGAGVAYWPAIAERYGVKLTSVSDVVDPTFGFMTLDWDGKIRMDCSSPYAMRRLIGMQNDFDVAWACDPDHDRHGIVTRSAGLMNPNHYLSVAIDYLYSHRPQWPSQAGVGKTVVSSSMIDRVTARLGRRLVEVPVGFKWFVDGLMSGALGFGGERERGRVVSAPRQEEGVVDRDKDRRSSSACLRRR